MKKKLLALGLMVFGFIGASSAQTSSSASATAATTILQPLEIVKTSGVNMNFGTVAADPTVETTVVLGTDDSRSGTATVYNVGALSKAGSYDISGTANAAFSITLPELVLVNGGVPTAGTAMTITEWVSSLGTTSTLDGNGQSTLLIGATLTVGAAQLPGLYTSEPFNISVNYN